MLSFHRCDAIVEGEEEDHYWGDDFENEKDAGVVCGMIVVESHLADVADGISEEPYRVGDCGCEPEVSANREAQDSEDAYGEIGHADFVFEWAC
jgi:hypothetical protein